MEKEATLVTLKIGRSKLAKMLKALTADERFFYDHAGWSYAPGTEAPEQGRIRGAKQLAAAERKAEALGYTFNWDYDPDGCMGCECGSADCPCAAQTEHKTLWCWVEDADGKTLASLGSICGADRNYRRVVEAELAEEAIPPDPFVNVPAC